MTRLVIFLLFFSLGFAAPVTGTKALGTNENNENNMLGVYAWAQNQVDILSCFRATTALPTVSEEKAFLYGNPIEACECSDVSANEIACSVEVPKSSFGSIEAQEIVRPIFREWVALLEENVHAAFVAEIHERVLKVARVVVPEHSETGRLLFDSLGPLHFSAPRIAKNLDVLHAFIHKDDFNLRDATGFNLQTGGFTGENSGERASLSRTRVFGSVQPLSDSSTTPFSSLRQRTPPHGSPRVNGSPLIHSRKHSIPTFPLDDEETDSSLSIAEHRPLSPSFPAKTWNPTRNTLPKASSLSFLRNLLSGKQSGQLSSAPSV